MSSVFSEYKAGIYARLAKKKYLFCKIENCAIPTAFTEKHI
jgi:hypothetical protein